MTAEVTAQEDTAHLQETGASRSAGDNLAPS